MSGYFFRIVAIDLHSGTIADYPVAPDYFREYVGGSALAARLFLDLADPAVDPLGADNPLIVMTGPLVGTNFPGSSRFAVCAKSPQTGIWGESTSGGSFGAVLKKSGVDGLIIRGKASQPVYLSLFEGTLAINQASSLWGKDTFETIDTLKQIHADCGKICCLAIGPAGENLVCYASVCNDKGNHLGRIGIGAVMGSKNLKAIVVSGTLEASIVDGTSWKTTRKTALATTKASILSESLNSVGTAAAMELGSLTGDVPIKNWGLGELEGLSEALGGNAIAETILKKRKACFACPIACKPEVNVEHETYGIGPAPGPEYETLGSFGSLLLITDLAGVAKANDLCNRLGLDTISCGGTIAFVMEAREKGLYSEQELDHLDLAWGKIDAVLILIGKIARREGFGNRAAEGSAALARELGDQAAEFLVTIKGLELPMHDPRGYHGMGLAYMMSNRGACHLQHSCQAVEQGSVSWPEAGLEEEYTGNVSEGKAKMVYLAEGIGQMANAICICHFAHWAVGLQPTLDALNEATGRTLSLGQFIEIGQRAWLLKRVLNNLMGITDKNDTLPPRILQPLAEGGTEGTVPDEALLKSEYYAIRGLDSNGFPTEPTLAAFNLQFLVPLLRKQANLLQHHPGSQKT